MSNSLEISTEKMLEYFEQFDPLDFKYNHRRGKKLSEDWEKYAKITEYEKSNQRASLTKKNYAEDYANLMLVYDEKEQNETNVRLLQLVSNKIIEQYINISGMERLFSETYIEFEWEMHLSADYKKHNMKFYRDHFIHQIRDAYMMVVMLDECGFYEKVREVLENESESKVSRFVHRSLIQHRYHENSKVAELRKDDKEFYIRNLIYMASFMAALFHDIGYPEAYYMTTNRHIVDYIASLHDLNAEGSNIKRIYSLLQNSLLFRVVPFKEIEQRIANEEKPDHGALSAIIFLLHFYENGAIYKLVPYKTAAIELAALAIYNHTNAYSLLGKKDYTAYRPCFSLNPISYLLRICDDLQEWDRVYFVISNQPNLLLCSKCKTPIIRKREEGRSSVARYTCNCKRAGKAKQKSAFFQAFDGSSGFSYRRIFNVSVCDKLEIQKLSEGKRLLIKLNYDPYKLLYVTYLNPSYAKYRIKELNLVKLLMENQKEIPQIYLDYLVTSNPVLIKVKLLEQYFSADAPVRGAASAAVVVPQDFADSKAVHDIIKKNDTVLLDKCAPVLKKFHSDTRLHEYLKNALGLYIRLYQCLLIALKNNAAAHTAKKASAGGMAEEFLKSEGRRLSEKYVGHPELRCLIEDCFLQFSRMYGDIAEIGFYPDNYFEQYSNGKRKQYLYSGTALEPLYRYESEDYYYKAALRYMDSQNYEPLSGREEPEDYVDAYTDLYFFYLINEEIHKRTLSKEENGL